MSANLVLGGLMLVLGLILFNLGHKSPKQDEVEDE
jgi:hypothetical protein